MAPGPGSAPWHVRIDLGGGDSLGRGDRAMVSWWLPAGAARQDAYRVVTDDGHDTGRVESDRQTFVDVPGEDTSRRRTLVRVQVWTDLGPSDLSDPVAIDTGLLASSDWTAGWIGVTEDDRAPKGRRPAYWLRTTFDLTDVGPATAHVSALGLYELWLNGSRVGDHELAPGFTQYRDRVPYQSFDVTAHLRPGRNVVAVLLADGWYRGQVGTPRAADQFGELLAARLQLESHGVDAPSVLVTTGPGWRTATSHVVAADLIGGQHDDLRLLDPTIHDAAYDDSAWIPAPPRSVEVAVVREIAPPVRRVEELHPVSVTKVDDAQVVDLGQNINGWVRLARLGPDGTRVRLCHGEHLTSDGRLDTSHLDVNIPVIPVPLPLGQIDEVVSAGRGGDFFEPRFTTHGFRYVSVEGHPDALEVDDVTGVVVHSDLRRTGWFECSDERVNALHEAVVWSLRGNMCAIPTDCPQRERAGWTGDWQVFAPTAAYLYDVLAFTRSWLRDVRLDQRADGCVANMSPLPPAEGFDGPLAHLHGSAGWGDVVVSAPWDLYQAYGDISLLREAWDSARRWVDFAAAAATGGRHPQRVASRPDPAEHENLLWDTGFHWGEWLEPGAVITDFGAFARADKSEVATAYLHRSALTLARVGELIGADAATTEHYRRLAEGARRAWLAEFVDAEGALREPTQASHVRALAFGLVPDQGRAAVAARLAELVAEADGHLATGFLSTGLLLPALADHGQVGTAYTLLLQDSEPSWLTMIDRGATTTWEHWNGIDGDGVAHDSLNHYSKGAVASFLHRHVAGLRPTSPGYRRFRVTPSPGGGLTWARTSHESPYGLIEVEWNAGGGVLDVAVVVPPGTSAEVVLPDGSSTRLAPGRHSLRSEP